MEAKNSYTEKITDTRKIFDENRKVTPPDLGNIRLKYTGNSIDFERSFAFDKTLLPLGATTNWWNKLLVSNLAKI